MATIYVDGKRYDVREGQDLLTTCLSLGFNIPYFCWHPALHSVGSCRLCAVKSFRDENDTRGHIIMSCMTPISDGLRISTKDPEVLEFRASVIEWLMINHPHDCPICDEGGECHLQDMTVMTGHTYRRYRYKKNTYINQDLGPLLNHEMNRCIQCYRCVRFYRDYAGGRDLNVYGVNQCLFYGRFESGTLESEFSGNLVEICPTGVFTDKSLKRHYTRKWDLQTAPSVCAHCGLGCNTIPGERYGSLRRIYNRYNRAVNGYFLCDRGRYGYEFVNDRTRPATIVLKGPNGSHNSLPAEQAYDYLARLISESSGVIGIGSPRASLESNFVLRSLVGPENFSPGLGRKDLEIAAAIVDFLSHGPAHSASLHDVEGSDAVLVLGEDVSNTAPRMALAIRQSLLQGTEKITALRGIPRWNDRHFRALAREARSPIFVATFIETRLDDVATTIFRGTPWDLARLGFAVAREIDASLPPAEGDPPEVTELAPKIAKALLQAERPLVVSGSGSGSLDVVRSAAGIAQALRENGHECSIALVMPECNSFSAPILRGMALEDVVEAVVAGRAETVIVAENDLFRRMPFAAADELFQKAKHVIVADHLSTGCVQRANMVLPAATFAEGHGTLVSCEGRAQRFYRVMNPLAPIRETWRHIVEVTARMARPDVFQWNEPDALLAHIAEEIPALSGVRNCAPPAHMRMEGQKVPRQPHRYSGRTAMGANREVHEPKPPDDPDSPLAYSMEGYPKIPPPSVIPRFWAPGWNSVQSLNKFQSEVGGPLVGGDPGTRLFEAPPAAGSRPEYQIPKPVELRDDEWIVVPVHHVFGSEELSVLSPGIRELTPEPYVGLSPLSADSLGARAGSLVHLQMEQGALVLPVRLLAGLPAKVAALPVGLPGLGWYELPSRGTVTHRARKESDQ